VIQHFKNWSDLQKWCPTLDDIQRLSKQITEMFATTAAAESAQERHSDDWLAHCIYFIRDALLFCEFEQAVSYADAGRVIRVFKYWTLAFRGAGQHNYARECVEVLVKWKYEMTDALCRACEKAWFFNRYGRAGRWIAADLYLEQCNYWVKVRLDFCHTRKCETHCQLASLHRTRQWCNSRVYHC